MSTQRKQRKAHAKELVRTTRDFLDDLISFRSTSRMTQGEVAEIMGVTQSAVSQFEHYDSNPTLASIRRYALAVGVELVMEARPRQTEVFTSPAVRKSPLQIGVPKIEGGATTGPGPGPGAVQVNWSERKAEYV